MRRFSFHNRENRNTLQTVIEDCRAVIEVLANCGPIDAKMEAVSDEIEVTAGLIQKLVDENATLKLDQHDYRKKYDGYASRYAALESRMDSLGKERERKVIQYDVFSGFLAGFGETEELPVDFNEKLVPQACGLRNGLLGRQGGFHLPQRCRGQHGDIKPESAGVSGFCHMLPAAFLYVWKQFVE